MPIQVQKHLTPIGSYDPNAAQSKMIGESFSADLWVNNLLDVQHEPEWDTVTIASGNVLSTLTSAIFSNIGPLVGKTPAQTSLTQANKLPAPEAFSIYAIRLRYQENLSLLDLYNIIGGFAAQLIVGNKPYNTGPVWFYQAGAGVYGTTTASSTTIVNNGMPGRSDMHKLAVNIVLENQAFFAAQFLGNNYTLNGSGTGITYVYTLDGLHARGVQ